MRSNGSSPRVWGTCALMGDFKIATRFIPTCVGNMDAVAFADSYVAVHPHVCGEHCRQAGTNGAGNGSSPRVWGTLEGEWVRHGGLPVHPHVCGEHPRLISWPIRLTGSSPRVWGTCGRSGWVNAAYRFIPTCVGNISISARRSRYAARFIPTCVGNITFSGGASAQRTVHPHVCGEHRVND